MMRVYLHRRYLLRLIGGGAAGLVAASWMWPPESGLVIRNGWVLRASDVRGA